MTDVEAIPGLDGERRQRIAAGLWRAWQEEGRRAAILTGFSGLGKTEQVVRPLVARAHALGVPAILIDVPLHPTDLDHELTALVVEALRHGGHPALADACESQPNFPCALEELLRAGALIVVDECQRLLDPSTARPRKPLEKQLREIAQRNDDGCLWLVLNREVDPGWSEPFFTTLLEAPTELHDLERIVLQAVGTGDAEERFPAERRVEVVRRLGGNPRVLRLLGNLLRRYALEELLGPAGDVPAAPVEPRLLEAIENNLLAKAKESLSGSASALLRDLAVLRDEARWELVEAMGGGLGDVRALTGELLERYLMENRRGSYQVHPTVREVDGPALRGDEAAWRSAHLRAGRWYAQMLCRAASSQVVDTALTLHVAAARYHLVEARAFEDLRAAMSLLRSYFERNHGWTTPRPTDAGERDARISLLDVYLSEPGPAGVEFHLAKMLEERAGPGDLAKALVHAQRATVGEDSSQPWVLWIQLVRAVQGLRPAIDAAREAAQHVAPTRNLYSVYQFLGACLNQVGETAEAVKALLEGAERARGNEQRLVEQTQFLAAAEPTDESLMRIKSWIEARAGQFDPQLALGEIYLLQRGCAWHRAAQRAHVGSKRWPHYIQLALCEAMCWLGADEPQRAQQALDAFTLSWRREARQGNLWLASLVMLQGGNVPRASELLAVYLDGSAPTTEAGVRAVLLREWDHRVATIGEANPALMCPILPPAVTGLAANVVRPQYGPPVLPQHQSRPAESPSAGRRLQVLAIGTEWKSSHGGLSTLNRQLCTAFAAAGADVACVVVHVTELERTDAQSHGVTLVEATHTPGQRAEDALTRKPVLPVGFVPDVIIGHGRVTGPAAQVLAADHFPTASRLHFIHMAPDEIEWFKLDRGDDPGKLADERTRIERDLGRGAARVVAIGPRLHGRYLTELHPYGIPTPLRLDPGFEVRDGARGVPPPGTPWRILLLGRLEDEHLKGLDLAAKAVGLAASRRQPGLPALELVVRGAAPDTSGDLRERLRASSNFPGLSVVVRPFTTDAESLEADLGRASLVLMPSRKEGFGLAGLEAIAAGAPLLASAESGLGMMLCEALGAQEAGRIVVPMSGDDEQDSEQWARAVQAVLWDREAAFRQATEVRELLGRRNTWAGAVATLLAELGLPTLAT